MLRYGGVDEEDVLFFDALDSFEASIDSVSYEDSVNEVDSDLAVQEHWYDIWRKEPMSLWERRKRFFCEMGFGEVLLSPLQWHCHDDDDNEIGSVESQYLSVSEQIASSSDAASTSSPYSANRKRKESYSIGRIRDLQDSLRWQSGIFGNAVAEAGSNIQGMIREVDRPTLLSNFTRVVEKREFSNEKENCGGGRQKLNGMDWWKILTKRQKEEKYKHNVPAAGNGLLPKVRRIRVHNHRKKCLEFTALYSGQEIQAHKGFIWTMKFSPDGKFLATGGEDSIVRIWRVGQVAGVSSERLNVENLNCSKFGAHKIKAVKSIYGQKKSHPASVVVPDKVFKIEETPLHEFHDHTCDVLDLSWSKSNYLLSSSEDKTVRLWQVGCKTCVKVFHHNDYVSSVQFNPADDRYFISGSVDGKIRIWEVSENRVVDWADAHGIITAVCYRPNGQGCIVGSIAGDVRFYDASDNQLQLNAQFYVQGKKKSAGKRITGFQFSPEDPNRVIITSNDSKVWILDGSDVIHKCRGLRKSGNQVSASFTSNGKHIVTVGKDSHVYIWNYGGLGIPSSKGSKLISSCEHFFAEGTSVALPWLGTEPTVGLGEGCLCCSTQQLQHLGATFSCPRDLDCFSIGSWFFNDSVSRASVTWPEEKLPLWAVPVSGDDDYQHHHQCHHCKHQLSLPATWGMVIVTAGSDGMIRSFHNYGLPVRA